MVYEQKVLKLKDRMSPKLEHQGLTSVQRERPESFAYKFVEKQF